MSNLVLLHSTQYGETLFSGKAHDHETYVMHIKCIREIYLPIVNHEGAIFRQISLNQFCSSISQGYVPFVLSSTHFLHFTKRLMLDVGVEVQVTFLLRKGETSGCCYFARPRGLIRYSSRPAMVIIITKHHKTSARQQVSGSGDPHK